MSPTKYFLSDIPATITVTRRHHPLWGREIEVLSAGKTTLVVRLADGSPMKLPRRWTDADGARQGEQLEGDTQLSLAALRALLRLVEALGRRAVPAAAGCGEITSPPDNEEVGDAQGNYGSNASSRRTQSGCGRDFPSGHERKSRNSMPG